jgi:D-alanyl-lipoteichoic acid acyltransferase DltB (MBOAT superfamily)
MSIDSAPIRTRPGRPSVPHRQYQPVESQPSSQPLSPVPRGWLYPGEPETCRRDPIAFLRIWLHLAVLAGIFAVYRLEGRAMWIVLAIATAALPVHDALPYRWKKPFFSLISLAGFVLVFGLQTMLWVGSLASLAIGLCFTRFSWTKRALLVAFVGLTLALLRAGTIALPVAIPDLVWPVLGSILMFRLILFLYEQKYAETSPVDAAAYFTLLPNACFVHFPVVDFRAFTRGYFSAPIRGIQSTGLTYLTRGMLHLLCYRLVYHKLISPVEEIDSPAKLALFLVANYLLYLRVSGQFHIACGLLHLFGFQLPETHHRFLLASSFTDYWRRINIYWKDFMVRLVFHPVAFALRRRSQPLALGIATLAVFVTTWLLHGYQSFWLRGTWTLSIPDALFWGILGVLVLINVQLESRAKPRRTQKQQTARTALAHVLRTAATFVTITILWSLWSSPSLDSWLGLMRQGLFGVAVP